MASLDASAGSLEAPRSVPESVTAAGMFAISDADIS